MGVRSAGGDDRGTLRGIGLDRVVLGQQRPYDASGRTEAGQRVGAARHAGERVGMDSGLVCCVSLGCSDGSTGTGHGHGSGDSGPRLEHQRNIRSVCVSRLHLGRRPQPRTWLPLSQNGVTLDVLALFRSAAKRETAHQLANGRATVTEPSRRASGRRCFRLGDSLPDVAL